MALEKQYHEIKIVKVDTNPMITEDRVAIEEPLEMRLAGETLATTMRTPGDDHVLVLGFLFNEGFLSSIDQVGRVFHCGRTGSPEFGNVIDVLPIPGMQFDFAPDKTFKRGTLVNSACGVCGRTQIEDLLERCKPFETGATIHRDGVLSGVSKLSSSQPLFKQTGAVHGAATFDLNFELVNCFEDVGRHNATDKVIGDLLQRRLIGQVHMLIVSGRLSFEIIQKAAMARIQTVVGISAPTSLATNLAKALNMGLVGFVRGKKFSVYSGQLV